MDTYFGDLNEGTHIIADDIKIHGQDEGTHDKHLIQVLNQCRKVGLKLNADKCIFKATSIPFFGHVISDQGIKPDPRKVEEIKTMTTPMSKLELQSFLGLCNYLSICVPSLSSVLQPLCELTRKNTDFQWNSQYDTLYQCAKIHILENWQTSCYYDQDLPVSLETDASQSGLGAVLLQEGKPISFMSKALTDTQSRYSNIEREILGVVTGVKHFHQYLSGRQFTLYTDHKPIESLVLKPLVDTSPRVQRLMLHLSQYNMNVQYKAGKYLLLSDCLSRLSNPTMQEEDESLNFHVTLIESVDGVPNLAKACEALMEDPVSVLLGDLILNGWPYSCKELDQELKPYWIHHFNLSIVDGIILLGEDHIVVPVALHESFLRALHYTHQGITKTLARARNYAYWPGIAHDVLQLCCECEICAEDHAYPRIPNIHHTDAHGPGFKYSADIDEIDGHPHLIVIDYYSFTVFEWPLTSLATSSVIAAFKTIFSNTGIPLTLVTDNALCVTSEEFSDFAKSWNFNHTTSSPRYPKGNAHAEQAVGMAKQMSQGDQFYLSTS